MTSMDLRRGLRAFAVLAMVVWMGTSAAFADSFAVHLPSHRAESAARLATGLDQLTQRLAQALGGGDLQVEIFRKQEDLEAFLRTHPDVTLVLSEVSFLGSSPIELVPVGRFVLDGVGSYRRVVVVPAASPVRRLADLQGEELAVVRTASSLDHLASSVFNSELDPTSYFSALRQVVDDSEAVTDVLFGQAAAALVAEHSPLLQDNLDTKLRVVYRGSPISLPLLSVRSGAVDASGMQDLAKALEQIGQGDGSSILSQLGFEGLEAVRGIESVVKPSRGIDAERALVLALDLEGVGPTAAGPKPSSLPLPYIMALPSPEPVAEALLEQREP